MRERRGRSWNTKWDFVSALILKATLFHLPMLLHINRKLKDHVRKFSFTFWWSLLWASEVHILSSRLVPVRDAHWCYIAFNAGLCSLSWCLCGISPTEARTCWLDPCVWEQTEKKKNKAENKFVQQTLIRFNLQGTTNRISILYFL